MQIGVALMGGSFMPEYKGGGKEEKTAFDRLVEGYELALGMGYDYIEASAGEILALNEGELDELVRLTREGKFSLRYVNSFVRADLKICTAPPEDLKAYVDFASDRISKLGVKVIVFGSGIARMRPDDMPFEEGQKKYLDFVGICAEAGKKYGLVFALEPLNRGETNILNSVAEGLEIVKSLGRPEIRILADAFHMSLEGEKAKIVSDNSDLITHLHISEAPGRVYPGKFGGPYLIEFAKDLKSAGFDKDMTVECVFEDFEKEGPLALEFVKEKML
ncbi:MAG TPA: sugar phosphate isomerase/epimerase family protein [Clostridiales bacterium]|jgi:sugar phosphate isomerase/epimerase|nr:sugar phosphate isomerase/epimerase family protein [Clostridiales bacterium]